MSSCLGGRVPITTSGTQAHTRPHMKHTRSVSKDAGKMVDSMYFSKKYLTPPVILCAYKRHIKSKMEYCISRLQLAQSSLSRFCSSKASTWHCGWLFFTLQSFSLQTKCRKPRCFHCKSSDERHSLAPPVQTFTAKTCRSAYTGTKHPHSICITLVRRKFKFGHIFPKRTNLPLQEIFHADRERCSGRRNIEKG